MNNKQEIYLTELETDLMGVFVRHRVLSDETCVSILRCLADKLES